MPSQKVSWIILLLRYIIPQSQPELKYTSPPHPCVHACPQQQRVPSVGSIAGGLNCGPLLTSTPVNHCTGNNRQVRRTQLHGSSCWMVRTTTLLAICFKWIWCWNDRTCAGERPCKILLKILLYNDPTSSGICHPCLTSGLACQQSDLERVQSDVLQIVVLPDASCWEALEITRLQTLQLAWAALHALCQEPPQLLMNCPTGYHLEGEHVTVQHGLRNNH